MSFLRGKYLLLFCVDIEYENLHHFCSNFKMVGHSIELCNKVRTDPKKFENETKSENSKVFFSGLWWQPKQKHVTKDKELALEDNDACTKNGINKENQPTHNVSF